MIIQKSKQKSNKQIPNNNKNKKQFKQTVTENLNIHLDTHSRTKVIT